MKTKYLVFPGLFFLPLPHFPNILVRQHIVFDLFTLALFHKKQGHGNEEKAYGTKTNAFIGQL